MHKGVSLHVYERATEEREEWRRKLFLLHKSLLGIVAFKQIKTINSRSEYIVLLKAQFAHL